MTARKSDTFEAAQKKLWAKEIRTLEIHIGKQNRQTAAVKRGIRKQISAAEKQAKRLAVKLIQIEKKEPLATRRLTTRINLLRARIVA